MIETDEDLAEFFDTEEFAVEAIFRIGDGEPFAVPGIFDLRPPFTATSFKGFRPSDSIGEGPARVTGAKPRLVCRTSQIPGVKAGRATATVTGKLYNVFEVVPDSGDISTITLAIA